MRLSWNEMRARAAQFSETWKDATYERGETQSFYNDFFKVFGVERRKVASFEAPVKKLGAKQGFIDLFWKGMLLVEQKSAGRDLKAAKTQALDYFPGLKDEELPRFILLSDFQSFELHDLEAGAEISFKLAELHQHIEQFGFVFGVEKREFKDQDPVNIKAAELMGRLHDALKASGYAGHDLERLLVRLVFCLFADDTGIFDTPDMFLDLITQRTKEDGSDTGQWMQALFEVLNSPEDRRQKSLDEELAKFPYINGDLFAERLPIAAFDSKMRKLLIEACEFKWNAISPAIFGSLFQSVMNAKERRASGAHYTTEKNILKVIGPLFLDDLRAEFEKTKARRGTGRKQALEVFHAKLASLTFFDPACGCGNFLIIAYRELRALELEVLKELHTGDQRVLDVAALSKVDVSQFYGIEIGEFAACIAEVALWMMDHIMNNHLSLAFGEAYARIPIKASPHIHCADALELDWAAVLAPEKCSYVLGNPPFGGKKEQKPAQKAQVKQIFGEQPGAGEVDFVSCWFELAGRYLARSESTEVGFVSTKSICQGEQVHFLWQRMLLLYKCRISFAHRVFEWTSETKKKASVHVIIVGFCRNPTRSVRLFDYENVKAEPTERLVSRINPYLVDSADVTVKKANVGISPRPKISKGSEATDFGHLTLNSDERIDLIERCHVPEKYIRPFVGGDEYINSVPRYCLWLLGATPSELRENFEINRRLRAVATDRSKSDKKRTRHWANFGHLFSENRQPKSEYLIIPKVSSQRREYIPIGFLSEKIIVSGSAQFINTSDRFLFGLVSSKMHMCWMATVGGRTKSDYQYTNTLVYNTFPWPEIDEKAKVKIRVLAQEVLDARAAHPGQTLADLYDPDVMPADLRKAHKALDAAVDKLYRSAPFTSDRERVEHLFGLYEKLAAPMLAQASKPKTRRKKSE